MEIDTAMAARFLTALTGDRVHTFQTFAEQAKGSRTLNRILHGTVEQRAQSLAALNYKGAGVFVMVNRGDGCGRKVANVTATRALFVDLDGAPVEPVLSCELPPRIVVESSPGRWHCYWPAVDIPPARFGAAQKALADRFNADRKVHDLSRVMRLPGFLHNKGAPFLSRLVRAEHAPLTWHELVQAFGLADRMTLPDRIGEGERNSTLYRLAASAAQKGVPEQVQADKALQVNARRCDPPLPEAEVRQIVASAYRRPVQGAVAMPLAVLDGEAYRALDDACRTLLLLAYRKADSFGPFSLTHNEAKPWFRRKNTFLEARKRLEASGLLLLDTPARAAQPRNGRRGKSALYRLSIGAVSATYSMPRIGALSATPEALQAVGSRALDAGAIFGDGL